MVRCQFASPRLEVELAARELKGQDIIKVMD
jgi:hypothetical protein